MAGLGLSLLGLGDTLALAALGERLGLVALGERLWLGDWLLLATGLQPGNYIKHVSPASDWQRRWALPSQGMNCHGVHPLDVSNVNHSHPWEMQRGYK